MWSITFPTFWNYHTCVDHSTGEGLQARSNCCSLPPCLRTLSGTSAAGQAARGQAEGCTYIHGEIFAVSYYHISTVSLSKYRKYQPGGAKKFAISQGHRFQHRPESALEAEDLKLLGTVFAMPLRDCTLEQGKGRGWLLGRSLDCSVARSRSARPDMTAEQGH